jgi:hypothetical protein
MKRPGDLVNPARTLRGVRSLTASGISSYRANGCSGNVRENPDPIEAEMTPFERLQR